MNVLWSKGGSCGQRRGQVRGLTPRSPFKVKTIEQIVWESPMAGDLHLSSRGVAHNDHKLLREGLCSAGHCSYIHGSSSEVSVGSINAD